ncbi:hypothetical protein [Chitinophaga sp. S165]|uniref:hypothetical protein n=1 Tax=Chitinophaga sp. S165 TaxID=2135462 RepID=UPI000D86CDFD|nr:hypothetical protein [Chitinophaga sp. S165]PWV56133.1 hypothetical protein C7475_101647 [Chitinophaga sp. S165]
MVVIYSVLVEVKSKAPILDVRLEDNMASAGNLVVVSGLWDNKRTIYLSEDSGQYFKPINAGWPVRDSPVFIGFTRKKNLFVVEKNGRVRVKLASSDNFADGGERPPLASREVTGVAIVPNTDSIYLYGRFPFIVGIDINNVRDQHVYNTGDTIASMAISLDHRVKFQIDHRFLFEKYLDEFLFGMIPASVDSAAPKRQPTPR